MIPVCSCLSESTQTSGALSLAHGKPGRLNVDAVLLQLLWTQRRRGAAPAAMDPGLYSCVHLPVFRALVAIHLCVGGTAFERPDEGTGTLDGSHMQSRPVGVTQVSQCVPVHARRDDSMVVSADHSGSGVRDRGETPARDGTRGGETPGGLPFRHPGDLCIHRKNSIDNTVSQSHPLVRSLSLQKLGHPPPSTHFLAAAPASNAMAVLNATAIDYSLLAGAESLDGVHQSSSLRHREGADAGTTATLSSDEDDTASEELSPSASGSSSEDEAAASITQSRSVKSAAKPVHVVRLPQKVSQVRLLARGVPAFPERACMNRFAEGTGTFGLTFPPFLRALSRTRMTGCGCTMRSPTALGVVLSSRVIPRWVCGAPLLVEPRCRRHAS